MRALALAAILCTGCSPLFMETVELRQVRRGDTVHCTSSYGFPMWDAAEAAGAIAVGGLIVTSDNLASGAKGIGGAGTGAFAVGHLLSAVWGARSARECTRARLIAAGEAPPL